MSGFMRLVVCGGLFVAGYYLGRRSCGMELELDQPDIFEDPDAVPESDRVDPDKKQPGG